MNINIIDILIYAIVAVVVAIISATIIRAKMSNRFDIESTFISTLFGVVWPLTVFIGIVYSVSGFLYDKFFKVKEN